MALAEFTHHSAQRQKTARTGGEARVVLHGHVPEAPLPQGSRPPCLGEPRGPQDQDQLRTVEQAAAYAPMVQILDAPVPQMVEQLPDIMHFFDTLTRDPEQAIEVPKILLDDVPVRTLVRDTQLVEQLVEVPTIISYSSLRRTTEQHVDIPVPRRGGRHPGLQGFPPRQSSTATPSKKRISERIVEQIVDIPGGGLQDFRPGQSSSSSSHRRNAQANGGGLQSSLVVARWPVFPPWRLGLLMVSVGADFWWSPRLSRFELLTVHWYVWLLWLYGGLTECYSSVSELGWTVVTCSATLGS